jgi:predicted enzyme related to lactoylglutathione lyase
MPVSEGGFVWYEHMTRDLPAAEDFYGKVVGWLAEDSGMPGMRYTLLKIGDRPVAGVMAAPKPGDMPCWLAHILTSDVDGMAERVKQGGGAVHKPPSDIPGVGRFAVVADPQGAVFMLFRADGTPAPDLAPMAPGAIGWHELHARDWETAFPFYADLFGWKKSQAIDMGPMGTYQTFDIGGAWGGGMMNDAQAPAPFWLYYFSVEDIDAAAARITGAGGTLLQGPHQVPGGSWIVQAHDPQGGLFALVGPRTGALPS